MINNYDFETGIEKYINHIKVRNYSHSTVNNYQKVLKNFIKVLTTFNVKNNKNSFIEFFEEYLLNFQHKGLSSGYCYIIFTAVRNLFRYMEINYLEDFEPLKRPKSIPKPLTDEQLFDLLHSVRYNPATDSPAYLERAMRDEAILYLFYATGLRVSELCNIRLTDINFNENLITVIGKGNKERIVVFDKITKKILVSYLNRRQTESDYLFPNPKTKNRLSVRGVEKIVKKYGESVGVKVTPHMLRHSFATHLRAKGMDIRYIQTLMGHESIATTQVYTKVNLDNIRHEYNMLK